MNIKYKYISVAPKLKTPTVRIMTLEMCWGFAGSLSLFQREPFTLSSPLTAIQLNSKWVKQHYELWALSFVLNYRNKSISFDLQQNSVSIQGCLTFIIIIIKRNFFLLIGSFAFTIPAQDWSYVTSSLNTVSPNPNATGSFGASALKETVAKAANHVTPSACSPQLSKGCSLHLAQRWSQLFNIQLRRMPILSKDSAPGLIMATGGIPLELEHN